MARFIMFGNYAPDALKEISAQRSDEATAVIERNGGRIVAAHALLGSPDLVVDVELPDAQRALKTSIELSKLLGVSFTTSPAVSIEELDRLVAG